MNRTVDDRPSVEDVTRDKYPGMLNPEDSSAPKEVPEDRCASEWKQRQRPPQKRQEQNSNDMYGGRLEQSAPPRDSREPNQYQDYQSRGRGTSNSRNGRSYSKTFVRRPRDGRNEYLPYHPRHVQEWEMPQWKRNENYTKNFPQEKQGYPNRSHPREHLNDTKRCPQSSQGRPVPEVSRRSSSSYEVACLHDMNERLRADLMASEDHCYFLEKDNVALEYDLEELRVKYGRIFTSMREQDHSVKKMEAKILMQKEKIKYIERELTESKKEAERFQMELEQLRAERNRMDEKIREGHSNFSRQKDELNGELKKASSQFTSSRKDQGKLQSLVDENMNLKREIKVMKLQLQRQKDDLEPKNRSYSRSDFSQAHSRHPRKEIRTDQLRATERNANGQRASSHQDIEEGKLTKQEQKSHCFHDDNSRFIDEKFSDRNLEKNRIPSKVQSQNIDSARHVPVQPNIKRRSRYPSPEEREVVGESNHRGRSQIVRGTFHRPNNHDSSSRWGARSLEEPPRWFSQMDRSTRDNLERLFTKAEKDHSGDPEAIQRILEAHSGLQPNQCSDIYNYFMRSDFVYRGRKSSLGSNSRYRNRSPIQNNASLNTFITPNSGPTKYNGPLKGRSNTFWTTFRNPQLKEQIIAAQGPVLTPTETPETSPEPDSSLKKTKGE